MNVKLIDNSKKFNQLIKGDFGDCLIGITTFSNLLQGIKKKITSVNILEKNINLKNNSNLRILFCLQYLQKITSDYLKYISPLSNNQLFTYINQELALIRTYIVGFTTTNKLISDYLTLNDINQDIFRNKILSDALNVLIELP